MPVSFFFPKSSLKIIESFGLSAQYLLLQVLAPQAEYSNCVIVGFVLTDLYQLIGKTGDNIFKPESGDYNIFIVENSAVSAICNLFYLRQVGSVIEAYCFCSGSLKPIQLLS